MKTKNIVEGLQILMPYYDQPDGYHASAEHDVLSVYPTDKPMSIDDVAKLVCLGWSQDYDDRDYNRSFTTDDYRSSEGWRAFV